MRHLFLLLSTLLVTPVLASPAGQLALVRGNVSVQSGGAPVAAIPGVGIGPGETVKTGASAEAAARMADDGLLLIGESTAVGVSEFAFDPRGSSPNRLTYKLDSGSVRIISGVIGKRPGELSINTAYGDVTSMGTDFTVGICDGGCQPAGVYVTVNSGLVRLVNAAGEQIGAGGTIIFAGVDGQIVPVLVSMLPDGLVPAPEAAVTISQLASEILRLELTIAVCDPEASPSQPGCTASR